MLSPCAVEQGAAPWYIFGYACASLFGAQSSVLRSVGLCATHVASVRVHRANQRGRAIWFPRVAQPQLR